MTHATTIPGHGLRAVDALRSPQSHDAGPVRSRQGGNAESIFSPQPLGAGSVRSRRLREADNWLRGKSSLTKTDVVLLLLAEADRDMGSLPRRYADFAFTAVARWIDELLRYGRFQHTPLDEAYRRLQYLLDADLFVYLGSREDQRRLKADWAQEYTVADPSALPPSALISYLPFLTAARRL